MGYRFTNPAKAASDRLWDILKRGTFRFQFLTCPGQEYHVDYQDDLRQTQWQPLETVFGDEFLKTMEIPIADQRQRLYRGRTL